jgi:SAM-dependent methyltransferase
MHVPLGMPGETLEITHADLLEVFQAKHRSHINRSSLLLLWQRLRYFTPDEYYETLVSKLVNEGTAWIDVGCGRDLFPYNRRLGDVLSKRCPVLVGADPCDNLDENQHVRRRIKESLEDIRTEETFTLATLRMVVEHITRPEPALASLARLVRPGGLVVVYTINRWSPLSLVAKALPFTLHHPIMARVWRAKEKDTFQVSYLMNTRGRLRELFESHGFRERSFRYLDDCRTFFRFPLLHYAELALWRMCKLVGLVYPENCLLGVYERVGATERGGENER